jgi:hypothetical protein
LKIVTAFQLDGVVIDIASTGHAYPQNAQPKKRREAAIPPNTIFTCKTFNVVRYKLTYQIFLSNIPKY